MELQFVGPAWDDREAEAVLPWHEKSFESSMTNAIRIGNLIWKVGSKMRKNGYKCVYVSGIFMTKSKGNFFELQKLQKYRV